jgi:hypothetical protein
MNKEELIKVFLPGESPWVKFVRSTSETTFIGKIDNNLINTEQHGFNFGDEVEFELKDYGAFKSWEPKGMVNKT